jgi:hypothetical protein
VVNYIPQYEKLRREAKSNRVVLDAMKICLCSNKHYSTLSKLDFKKCVVV